MQRSTKRRLFLLHGWGFDHEVMKEFLSYLGNDFAVTPLTVPGYGATASQNKTRGLAAIVEALFPQIPENSILCGWSLGGILAIKLAEKLQDRICALVLITSTPCFVQKEDWMCGVDKKLIEKMLLRIANGDKERVMKEFSMQVASGDRNTKKIKRYLDNLLVNKLPDNDVLIDGLKILAETDLRIEFKQLTCPAILFLSDHDDLIASTSGDEIKKLNPAICLEYLKDTGHAPFLSDPAGLGELMKKRLREII